jgi:phosphocarrier protein HPr
MLEKPFVIKNKLGLHARPAALLVQTAGKFKSKVKIIKDEQEVDGKSIMGLMTLAAAAGSSLKIITDGEDEKDALDCLGSLVESGFGED